MIEVRTNVLRNSGENAFNDIPHEWKFVTLGNLGKVVTGRTPQTDRETFYGGEYKLISPANLTDNMYVRTAHKWLTEEGFNDARPLPKDTVLVSCIGYIGKTGITIDDRSATNQQINAIICNPGINPQFVYFLMTFYRSYLKNHARITTVPILSKTNFEAVEIPLPPLHEQRAIAHVLSTVRRSIEASERVIAAARELKRSMMKYLFTYGPVPVDQAEGVKLKRTEIGEVPEEWEVVKLGDYSDISVSTSSLEQAKKLSTLNRDAMTILYLKVSDLNIPSNRRLVEISSNQVYINTDELNQLRYIPIGSIVFPKRGAAIRTNKKRLLNKPALLDPNLIAVTPKDKVNPQYCHYWFELFDLSTITDDNTLPQLNKKDVEPIAFPIPSMGKQGAIVKYINRLERKVEIEIIRHNAIESLFNSLLHHLMTGKVRVRDLPVFKSLL
jgi:type I restriction enzyme, S subunit